MHRYQLSLLVSLLLPSLATPQEPPAQNVVASADVNNGDVPILLRIPAKLISKSVNLDFEHRGPVHKVLLGTTSVGTSHCKGQVACVVEENPTGVSILCRIAGTVESTTRGTNGPAIIYSKSTTQYVSIKRLTFDGKLFASKPATVTSCTQLTITGIESTLPRLRGQLVIRVAKASAQKSHAQVEAIIKCQAEEELCRGIDADFDLRVTDLNRQFASRLAIVKFIPNASERLHLRSRVDGIEISLGHSPKYAQELLEDKPIIGESVEVWFRRNENLIVSEAITSTLFSKAPLWLASYFTETPLFLKPDERKWGVEFGDKWIVLKLYE